MPSASRLHQGLDESAVPIPMNRRCKVVSGQWRRRSLAARRLRAAPRRALRRAIPRKVHFQRAAGLRSSSGRSWRAARSGVEHSLAKVGVVGSNPIARSILPNIIKALPEMGRLTTSIASLGEAGGKQPVGFWLLASPRVQEKGRITTVPAPTSRISTGVRFEAGRLASRGRSRPL